MRTGPISACITSPVSSPRRSRCSRRLARKTSRIEIGTAVIDMRYENPLYMAEDAGAADLIAGGRLQLGISRGLSRAGDRRVAPFRLRARRGRDRRRHGAAPRRGAARGAARRGLRGAQPAADVSQSAGLLRLEPHSEGLRDRIWWGAASNATADWAAKLGMNLQSSTLKDDESGQAVPRPAGRADPGLPRGVEGGRPPARAASVGQPQHLRAGRRPRPGLFRPRRRRTRTRSASSTRRTRAIFGRSYAAEPDVLVEQLAKDEAIAEADTLLLTVPEPARRRLQRPRHRGDPDARGTGARLALTPDAARVAYARRDTGGLSLPSIKRQVLAGLALPLRFRLGKL